MAENIFENSQKKMKTIQKCLSQWLPLVKEGSDPKAAWETTFAREAELQGAETGSAVFHTNSAAFCACTGWLILPGTEPESDLPAGWAERWNSFVLAIHARTAVYRQDRETLCSMAEALAETLYALQEGTGRTPKMRRLMENGKPGSVFCIGREKEISRIRACLQKEGLVFLCGIGGSGKTTLARAYAAAYAPEYDTIVLARWDGSVRQMIADDNKIGIRGLTYQPSGHRGELGWYCRKKLSLLAEITDGRTLLILDGVDRFEKGYPEKFFSLPCHILITTRRRFPAYKEKCIAVGALEQSDDRRTLFASSCGGTLSEEQRRDFEKIDRLCQGHTLTLSLLGKRFREGRRLSFDEAGDLTALPQIFALDGLSRKERQILRNAALLPAGGMTSGDFLLFSGTISAQEIQRLADQCLLEYEEKEQIISLHPVIRQEVLRALPVRWRYVRSFVRAFCKQMENFWHFSSQEKQRYGLQALVMLRTLGMPEAAERSLAFVLADLLWQVGCWNDARKYTKKLYEDCLKQEGATHPDTARAAGLAASVSYNQGHFKEAADWYLRCWESYEGLKKKEPFYEAQYRYKYARYLEFYGRETEADRQLDEAERIYVKEIKSGNRAEEMKAWLINLYIERTRTELARGNADAAARWQEQAQALSVCGYGGEATEAFIRHDQGRILLLQGEKSRARACLKRAKELAKRSLGEKSREYEGILSDLRRVGSA